MTEFEDKNILRREMRKARKSCADRAERDDEILKKLTALPVYKEASCVLSYVSFGTEADTRAVLSDVLSRGKMLYVPRCVPNSNRMIFYRITSLTELTPGAYGILEPEKTEEYTGSPDALCLVPGLAFSEDGARLGYGKGYYDTFFSQHPMQKIGLCYDFQLLPQIPTQPHDIRMDGVLTDSTFYACPKQE